MTLIAIVIALFLERVLSYSPQWRAHSLTDRWIRLVDDRIEPRSWSLGIYVLLPVALIATLQYSIVDLPAGEVLILPVALIILLACLGPRDLREEVHSLEAALARDDQEEAESLLRDLLSGPLRHDGPTAGRSPVAACFVQGHERWFAVLLWFFVLGLPGAVAYRMLASVACHLGQAGRDDESQRLAEVLHGAMAWPSSRAAALLYGLAGSADHAFARWREWASEYDGEWVRSAWPLLAQTGLAALARDPDDEAHGQTQCLDRAVSLLDRSMLILLALLALLTIGGWMT